MDERPGLLRLFATSAALLLLAWPPGAAAQDKARGGGESQETLIWRVCIGDAAVPPYLNNDPLRPGIIERILVRAGAEAGLSTLMLRYPTPRCRSLVKNGTLDAWIAAPTDSNLGSFLLPMKDGAVDFSRRLVRINLVWVKRAESPYEWKDGRMLGGTPEQMLVGQRSQVQSILEPLRKMGFRVDDLALTTHQALLKLQRGRVDIVVALQEEVQVAMQDPALQTLVVLPNAMTTAVFYMGVRPGLTPELQAQVETWWSAIGRARDLPEFQPR